MGTREDACQSVVIGGWYQLTFEVMAARPASRHLQESHTHCAYQFVSDVQNHLSFVTQHNRLCYNLEKSGGHNSIVILLPITRPGQQITGELFDDKFILGLVTIK